mgnify:CR=1 FL=1|jgi:hypothetical protein
MSVIIYLDHIEELEQENEELKQEVIYLKTLLENDSQSTAIRRSTITRKDREV